MNIRRLSVTPALGLIVVLLIACQNTSTLQANAGADLDLTVGEAPKFDGCASTGDIVNYQLGDGWQPGKPLKILLLMEADLHILGVYLTTIEPVT